MRDQSATPRRRTSFAASSFHATAPKAGATQAGRRPARRDRALPWAQWVHLSHPCKRGTTRHRGSTCDTPHSLRTRGAAWVQLEPPLRLLLQNAADNTAVVTPRDSGARTRRLPHPGADGAVRWTNPHSRAVSPTIRALPPTHLLGGHRERRERRQTTGNFSARSGLLRARAQLDCLHRNGILANSSVRGGGILTAVCVTGQLRGLGVALPSWWQMLISNIRGGFDLFYVGPHDSWYAEYGALLHALPQFVEAFTYRAELSYAHLPNVSEMLHFDRGALFVNLARMPYRFERDARTIRIMLQLKQHQDCLRLLRRRENTMQQQYHQVLRLRPDVFFDRPVLLDEPMRSNAVWPMLNHNCCGTEHRQRHDYLDFASFGPRQAMQVVLNQLAWLERQPHKRVPPLVEGNTHLRQTLEHVREVLGPSSIAAGPRVGAGLFRTSRSQHCYRLTVQTDVLLPRATIKRLEANGPPAAIHRAASQCFGYQYDSGCTLEGNVGEGGYDQTLTDRELGPWLGQPLSQQPGEPGMIGHCGVTYTRGDCMSGESGFWPMREINVTTLDECAAYCKQHCARCSFVSFSAHPRNAECSWYAHCPQLRLLMHGERYLTKQVNGEAGQKRTVI